MAFHSNLFIYIDNKDAVICFLLPYLIEGAKEKRRNTENEPAGLIKLSVQERRDSFILHVQVTVNFLPINEIVM